MDSFHLYAPEFHKMKCLGFTEQLKPQADQIQIAYYKLQQYIGEAKPNCFDIELGAIEDITLGKAGKALEPQEILNLVSQRNILVWRRTGSSGTEHARPINELPGGIGDEANRWFGVIQAHIQTIRDVLGLNEFTDGSSPDPRSLTTTANLAVEASNNSLYTIVEAEHYLLRSISKSLAYRLQDKVRKGEKVTGYVTSSDTESSQYVTLSKKVGDRIYDLKISPLPTAEEKQALMVSMQTALGQGALDPDDMILIQNTDNLKQAAHILAFRIRKRREEMEKAKIAHIEATGKAQAEAAQAAEQAKQQTESHRGMVKAELEVIKGQVQEGLKMVQGDIDIQIAEMKELGRIITQALTIQSRLGLPGEGEQAPPGGEQPPGMEGMQPQPGGEQPPGMEGMQPQPGGELPL
jgi:hypothetical protein